MAGAAGMFGVRLPGHRHAGGRHSATQGSVNLALAKPRLVEKSYIEQAIW
jgi:hypothetical protein